MASNYTDWQGPPPPYIITFGRDSTCTLDLCPLEWSVYRYRPNLAANVIFVVAFAIIGIVHCFLGFHWKSPGFMTGMLLGCISSVIGYVGRIVLRTNPFAFEVFMIQISECVCARQTRPAAKLRIVCLTIAPVFFTASIYVTLSKTIVLLAPELSRFRPQLLYWIFIPADIMCLALQAAGGAMSVLTDNSQAGVDISLAGLILQVVVIIAFVAAFADYMLRYWRSGKMRAFGWRLGVFFIGLSASSIFILTRCIYRVFELKDGYDGDLITHEIPFIVLEGIIIVLASIALMWGHPGLASKALLGRSKSEVSAAADGNRGRRWMDMVRG